MITHHESELLLSATAQDGLTTGLAPLAAGLTALRAELACPPPQIGPALAALLEGTSPACSPHAGTRPARPPGRRVSAPVASVAGLGLGAKALLGAGAAAAAIGLATHPPDVLGPLERIFQRLSPAEPSGPIVPAVPSEPLGPLKTSRPTSAPRMPVAEVDHNGPPPSTTPPEPDRDAAGRDRGAERGSSGPEPRGSDEQLGSFGSAGQDLDQDDRETGPDQDTDDDATEELAPAGNRPEKEPTERDEDKDEDTDKDKDEDKDEDAIDVTDDQED